MKTIKRLSALLLAFLLVVSVSGCIALPESSNFVGSTDKNNIGSPLKYYFEGLEDDEKQAYNAILDVIKSFPERIEVPSSMDQDKLLNVYAALLYDNPELFFLNNKTAIRQSQQHSYFYPNYIMGSEDYAAMLKKCDMVVDRIVQDANSLDDVFEQELLVHDSLIAQCVYNDDSGDLYKSTIYGVLCAGSAACEGYAKTAKYIFDKIGIPCFVMTGTSTPPGAQSQGHMWDVVQIDGDYYHLDLTWDDPVLEDGGSIISYDYFNVTDDDIRNTHTDYECRYDCTATKANYYVHEDKLLQGFSSADRERAVTIAANAIERGNNGFALRFSTESAYTQAQDALFEKEGVYDLLSDIQQKTSVSFATDRVSFVCSDEQLTITIMVETTN